MSKRDRGTGFKIVTWLAVVLVTVLLMVLIFDSGSEYGIAVSQYERNSNAYARHAEQDIEGKCLDLDTIASVKCIRDVVEATNEHELSERDLVAQTEMALWAFWMLLVTATVAVITAVGVIFVWKTLVATQVMARDTREIGEAQVRAYLSVQEVEVEIGREGFHGSSLTLTLSFTVKNFGQSPARGIRADIAWNRSKAVGSEDVSDIPANDGEPVKIRARTSLEELSITEGATPTVRLWAEVKLQYRTVFMKSEAEAEIRSRLYGFDVELVDSFTAKARVLASERFTVPRIGDFAEVTVNAFGEIIDGKKASEQGD